MTRVGLTDALAISFLSELPGPAIDALIAEAVEIRLPPAGLIYRHGDEPRAGLVVEGLLRVYMVASSGRQVTVRYARAGDVLGIAAAVGGPPPVSVQAVTESELWMISVQRLLDMGERDPAVAMPLARELTRRLYETLEELAGHAFGTVGERVAHHLLDMAARSQEESKGLVARVTHQELADAVGSSREVVTRAIGRMRRAGVVEPRGDGIWLLDPAKLHAIASSDGW